MASMIAAVCWVPRGAANPVPVTAEPTEEELEAMKLALEEQGDGRSDGDDDEVELEEDDDDDVMAGEGSSKAADPVGAALAAARALGGNEAKVDNLADGLADLDMDHYDDEDEGPDSGLQLFGNGGLGAAYYATNEDDPYLISKEDDDEEEIEDMTIKQSDLLLLTARTEDDVSHLEVWVYEDPETNVEGGSNMYVHHDIMLSAFPLALAWLDCGPADREKGNFVAVSTMHPEIEIWDLDVVDAVEPVAMLGGAENPIPTEEKEVKSKKSKKKKKKKEVKLKEGSHTDAVLGLAWNVEFRNVLASGSADHSVKIWDVNTLKCEYTVQCHNDKVQAVAWNRRQPTVLISGSFDGTVAMVDGRAPGNKAIWWAVSADVESLAWDPHTEHSFVVSLEDGTVRGHDIRTGGSVTQLTKGSTSNAVYTIHAHEKAVCSVSYNLVAPNLLATGSMDKTVKLWDLANNQPTCIGSLNPKVGAVFSSSFCKDLPFLLAVGGSKGNLHVWNTLQNSEVAQRFQSFAS
ncbi:unnamed protein product [Calypogeia fissa]